MENKPETENSNLDPKTYLDYMDKEMTFCGIITAFCLAAVSLLIDKYFSVDKSSDVIFVEGFKSIYFLVSLGSLLVAAFLLFRLRANLAYYYGQISLEVASKGFTKKTIEELLRAVDAWRFWYPYFYGIALIVCSFIQFAIIIVMGMYQNDRKFSFLSTTPYSYITAIITIGLSILGGYITIKIYKKNEDATS